MVNLRDPRQPSCQEQGLAWSSSCQWSYSHSSIVAISWELDPCYQRAIDIRCTSGTHGQEEKGYYIIRVTKPHVIGHTQGGLGSFWQKEVHFDTPTLFCYRGIKEHTNTGRTARSYQTWISHNFVHLMHNNCQSVLLYTFLSPISYI